MAFKLTKKDAANLQKLVDAYESARSDLAQALEDIASGWEIDFEERSDKWKESEPGQSASAHIDLIRSWCDEFPDEFPGNAEDLL